MIDRFSLETAADYRYPPVWLNNHRKPWTTVEDVPRALEQLVSAWALEQGAPVSADRFFRKRAVEDGEIDRKFKEVDIIIETESMVTVLEVKASINPFLLQRARGQVFFSCSFLNDTPKHLNGGIVFLDMNPAASGLKHFDIETVCLSEVFAHWPDLRIRNNTPSALVFNAEHLWQWGVETGRIDKHYAPYFRLALSGQLRQSSEQKKLSPKKAEHAKKLETEIFDVQNEVETALERLRDSRKQSGTLFHLLSNGVDQETVRQLLTVSAFDLRDGCRDLAIACAVLNQAGPFLELEREWSVLRKFFNHLGDRATKFDAICSDYATREFREMIRQMQLLYKNGKTPQEVVDHVTLRFKQTQPKALSR